MTLFYLSAILESHLGATLLENHFHPLETNPLKGEVWRPQNLPAAGVSETGAMRKC